MYEIPSRDHGSGHYGDAFGRVTAVLDTGDLRLPALQLPVINPKDPSVYYGSLLMKPQLKTGFTELSIDVNVSTLVGQALATKTLFQIGEKPTE